MARTSYSKIVRDGVLQIAHRAGHCGYPSKTVRGKCWRKTRVFKTVNATMGDFIVARDEFRCYQHWSKP